MINFTGFCAHNRAHRFFSESLISDTPFVAVRCERYEGLSTGCCTPTGDTLNMGGFTVNYGYDEIDSFEIFFINKTEVIEIKSNWN